jgi:hypothetical protein
LILLIFLTVIKNQKDAKKTCKGGILHICALHYTRRYLQKQQCRITCLIFSQKHGDLAQPCGYGAIF